MKKNKFKIGDFVKLRGCKLGVMKIYEIISKESYLCIKLTIINSEFDTTSEISEHNSDDLESCSDKEAQDYFDSKNLAGHCKIC